MAYCTLTDIQQHILDKDIAQVTDDVLGQTINESLVAEKCAEASEIVDGFLRGRYTLPLTSIPSLITSISCDIAIYKLYERRFVLDMPESLQKRYDNAFKLLKSIQAGQLLLGIESIESGPGSGQYKTNKSSKDRIFGKDVLEKY